MTIEVIDSNETNEKVTATERVIEKKVAGQTVRLTHEQAEAFGR